MIGLERVAILKNNAAFQSVNGGELLKSETRNLPRAEEIRDKTVMNHGRLRRSTRLRSTGRRCARLRSTGGRCARLRIIGGRCPRHGARGCAVAKNGS